MLQMINDNEVRHCNTTIFFIIVYDYKMLNLFIFYFIYSDIYVCGIMLDYYKGQCVPIL